jgi:alcohol dehydrogenase/propanol-preferring alcohol dehydrogenase
VVIRDALHGPAAVVLDFVGSPETAELGLSVLRKGGSMVLIGLHGGSWPLPVPYLPLRNVTLVGSLTGTVGETREVVDFVRKHHPARVPISTVPLSGANQALMNLESGASTGRQVLVPKEAL